MQVVDHVIHCEEQYYWAGGYGPERDIDWPEDQDSPEYEEAEAAYFEWYNERSEMFWELVKYKAGDVVLNHYESIVRVAIALCYHGTLSRVQVKEIVEQVEGAERNVA